MQIKNPSNNAIKDIKIYGVTYSIDAEGTLDNVPEDHARYWQESIHKFLILRKDKLEAKPEVVEVPAPAVTEVVQAPSVQDPEVIAEALETPAEVTSTSAPEEVVVPTKSKGRPKSVK